MISSQRQARKGQRVASPAPMRRPGAVNAEFTTAPSFAAPAGTVRNSISSGTGHPLCKQHDNDRLYQYERSVKDAFDRIVPVLKKISALQHEADFERLAQSMAQQELGFQLPESILADAWVEQLDMRVFLKPIAISVVIFSKQIRWLLMIRHFRLSCRTVDSIFWTFRLAQMAVWRTLFAMFCACRNVKSVASHLPVPCSTLMTAFRNGLRPKCCVTVKGGQIMLMSRHVT